MFERFTEKAIKVIMLAQEEARRLGHNLSERNRFFWGLLEKELVLPQRPSNLWV